MIKDRNTVSNGKYKTEISIEASHSRAVAAEAQVPGAPGRKPMPPKVARRSRILSTEFPFR